MINAHTHLQQNNGRLFWICFCFFFWVSFGLSQTSVYIVFLTTRWSLCVCVCVCCGMSYDSLLCERKYAKWQIGLQSDTHFFAISIFLNKEKSNWFFHEYYDRENNIKRKQWEKSSGEYGYIHQNHAFYSVLIHLISDFVCRIICWRYQFDVVFYNMPIGSWSFSIWNNSIILRWKRETSPSHWGILFTLISWLNRQKRSNN